MNTATDALMRMGALCALAALADVVVSGARLKSAVRLIASLLLVLAMMDMAGAGLALLGLAP